MSYLRHKSSFPLSLIKTKGQLYDIESMFLATRAGQHVLSIEDKQNMSLRA